ncbi:MAG TPA: glutamine--fructose-6-phosphate transaminase (isomerizing) [Candidatus Saccharimonadales bacterium]|nr:glutamine--fructose-6-phosphate transaminase (isomerizing) [Candidatus Saccharimonadales bacterium]
MCGIVGYIGRKNAIEPVISGLEALEYRGYDSAGIAFLANGQINVIKKVGRVEQLAKAAGSTKSLPTLAIGHTRWATHGAPSIINAHPHASSDKTIQVVHNGIIENFAELRDRLEAEGYQFVSQTDTEVIPHLIDYYLKRDFDMPSAFERTLQDLRGAYAIAIINASDPDAIYAARLSSPLILGVGDNEYILASDPTAVMEHTKNVVYLDDHELVVVKRDGYHIKNINRDKKIRRDAELLDFDLEQASLGDYPNFMLKEIFEAPQTIRSATLGRIKPKSSTVKLGGLESISEQLKYIERIIIVACGTSYYAGLVGEYLIEELAGIPVEVQLASEFKYREEPLSRSTAVLAISQSGETADTIAALRKVEGSGVLRLGIVNAVGSTIARITDAGVYCHAGPERAVASTKAFIAQVTVLAEIALHLGHQPTNLFEPLLKELDELPRKAEVVLAQADAIKEIAEKFAGYKNFLYIGRRYNYPCALEGALKLKEISYIHAEGYAAGEMKHGPLAMIDENFATFAIAPDGSMMEKTYSNIEEIRARSGPVVALATKGNKSIKRIADEVIYIPDCLEQVQPILVAIVLQLFSYYVAISLGKNVDRPRNLAKSVTVE